jgi:hypothetical protein
VNNHQNNAVLRIYNRAGSGNLALTGLNIGTPLTVCTAVGFTCQPTHFTFMMPAGVSIPTPATPVTIAQVVRTFGFTTIIVGPGQRMNNRGRIEVVGEEVISPFWVRVNPVKRVYVRQLTALHGCCQSNDVATLYRHVNPLSGTTSMLVIAHAGKYAQSFLPLMNAATPRHSASG